MADKTDAIDPTATIAVIGAGTMGAGIAEVAAQAGHPVVLFDADREAVTAAYTRIGRSLARRVASVKMDANVREQVLGRIRPHHRGDGLSVLRGAVLIIEAILEDLQSKRQLLQELDTIVGEDVILASNTSSLSITALARGIRRPERVIGMHFFNPAPAMKLVEIIRGLDTDPEVVACLVETVRNFNKTPIVAASTPGFVVNRVARAYYAEPLGALESGVADPATIDAVFTGAGFRLGPFALMDLIGIDVNYAVTQSVYEGFFQDARFRPSAIQREMVNAGYLGRKTERGFYRYDDDSTPRVPRPVTPLDPPRVPNKFTLHGDLGVASAIVDRLTHAGATVGTASNQDTIGAGYLSIADTRIMLSDGRPAMEIAATTGASTVVFDLVQDFASATRIAISASDKDAANVGASVLQLAGFDVYVVEDHPGLLVMRTVALIANEAFEAEYMGVASADDIDTAMRLGVNYPEGPLKWAREIGPNDIKTVIRNLGRLHAADRYRPSFGLLRRCFQDAMQT